MPPTLTTDRLTLQPLTADDAPDLFRIYRHPAAMRFMPTPPHSDADETRAMIERERGLAGAQHWAIRLKDTPQVIGQVNYLGNTRLPGMGYILHPDHWGQGITVEACRAALDYGFGPLGYDRVELWIDETNTASIRVAQKLGCKLRGRISMKYRHRPHEHMMLVWGVLASEWGAVERVSEERPVLLGAEPVLFCHDVQQSAEFYRDKLGFNIDFLYGEPPTHGGVSRGEWTGSMVVLQLAQVPPDREISPAAYLYIRVQDALDELFAMYQANGVEIVSAPANKPWGLREFTITDFNGHQLRFGTWL